jgi:hypothetical protein
MLRFFSYGGGVQSTAVLVLAAQGKVQYDQFLFSNVGDDSEFPGTLTYFREIAMPYAKEHGIELIELEKKRRDGSSETLMENLIRNTRSVGIPVRMSNGSPSHRNCTTRFKINVIGKHTKKMGASKTQPAILGLGISTDEIQRVRTDNVFKWQLNEYPLIDLNLGRNDCTRLIEEAGLPIPPKSSCWFCPFRDKKSWADMKKDDPALFQKAVDLEEYLTQKRYAMGRDRIYFHSSARPLDEAVIDAQPSFFDGDFCDSGYCLT